MEILPNPKYAITKMLQKYFIIYLLWIIFAFFTLSIIYESSIIFLLNNLLWTILSWSILVPLSLFLLEFYSLKTNKFKILLDNNGISVLHGKMLRLTSWSEYNNSIATTSLPLKIKIAPINKLVIFNLFNKKIIEEQIEQFRTQNNISKNSF